LAVLCDDTKNEGGQNTYTFVIFVNNPKLDLLNVFHRIAFTVMLAHEICHFAFYYELFLLLDKNPSSDVYNEFKKKIIGIFEEGVDTLGTKKVDKHIFPDLINRDNIWEIIEILENYPKEHFANNNPTEIDYREFFFHLLEHLKLVRRN
jgi:hypothetical protein